MVSQCANGTLVPGKHLQGHITSLNKKALSGASQMEHFVVVTKQAFFVSKT